MLLGRILVWFTWIWVVVYLPIETYLTWSFAGPVRLSGYIVDVLGTGIMLWGVISLRRSRPYAVGVLASGWAWTTAVFWRGTNARYWLVSQGEPLAYGSVELWLGPAFTVMAGLALLGSLVALVRRGVQPTSRPSSG